MNYNQIYTIGKVTMAALFIASGVLPLFSDPIERLRLLHHFPIPVESHQFIFYGLMTLDILCGLLILIRSSQLLWLGLICVVLGYTLAITLFAPELWRDPFATLFKNIPILSWLVVLFCLEKRRENEV